MVPRCGIQTLCRQILRVFDVAVNGLIEYVKDYPKVSLWGPRERLGSQVDGSDKSGGNNLFIAPSHFDH